VYEAEAFDDEHRIQVVDDLPPTLNDMNRLIKRAREFVCSHRSPCHAARMLAMQRMLSQIIHARDHYFYDGNDASEKLKHLPWLRWAHSRTRELVNSV
jgi:hypothetical protein